MVGFVGIVVVAIVVFVAIAVVIFITIRSRFFAQAFFAMGDCTDAAEAAVAADKGSIDPSAVVVAAVAKEHDRQR